MWYNINKTRVGEQYGAASSVREEDGSGLRRPSGVQNPAEPVRPFSAGIQTH